MDMVRHADRFRIVYHQALVPAALSMYGNSVQMFVSCVQGVRMAYYNYEADVLLLTMTNVIPDHFAAYEIGFDASRDAVPKRAVGIHHPGGVPTAISTVEAG